jgi:NitT/TauT family transport system permease protein
MSGSARRNLLGWLAPLGAGGLVLAAWLLVKWAWQLPDWQLPTPWGVAGALWHERLVLASAGWKTLQSAGLGFLAASLGGGAVALVLAALPVVRAGFMPYLYVLQMTPIVVIAPLIILWAGPGLPSIVVVVVLVSFLPVVVNTTQGLVSTDRNLVELFQVWNARRWQEFLLLRVPSAMPHYLSGLRIAAALAPVGAIFGEYLTGSSAGGTGGLGFRVYTYMAQIRVPELFATALASCLLGFLFITVISLVTRLLLSHWHESENTPS